METTLACKVCILLSIGLWYNDVLSILLGAGDLAYYKEREIEHIGHGLGGFKSGMP
jgi:hypothetical protein